LIPLKLPLDVFFSVGLELRVYNWLCLNRIKCLIVKNLIIKLIA
jgi:hypothetical protein